MQPRIMNYFSNLLTIRRQLISLHYEGKALQDLCSQVESWRYFFIEAGILLINKRILILQTGSLSQLPMILALVAEGAAVQVVSQSLSSKDINKYVDFDFLLNQNTPNPLVKLKTAFIKAPETIVVPDLKINSTPEMQLPRATKPQQEAISSWYKSHGYVYQYTFNHEDLLKLQPQIHEAFTQEVLYFFKRVFKKPEKSTFPFGKLKLIESRKYPQCQDFESLPHLLTAKEVSLHWQRVIKGASEHSER
jgi:hypothetical protein